MVPKVTKLVEILTFVIFCCVMLLLLQSFIDISESLSSSLIVINEQEVK